MIRDAEQMEEVALAGGNMNTVVRVGDTVLRQAGPWTPTVQRLLAHVRSRGVEEIPTPLGRGPDGREVLAFLPGTVPAYPMPSLVWNEQVLLDAARLLRRLHDASEHFDQRDAVWQVPAHDPAEVVCHNDFSPHNLVFRDGELIGAIDFDTCSPGPRIWDLAYLATRLVPLTEGGSDGNAPWSGLVHRLELLLRTYGSNASTADVLEVAHERLLDLADWSEAKSAELRKPELQHHAAYYRDEAAWLRQHANASRPSGDVPLT